MPTNELCTITKAMNVLPKDRTTTKEVGPIHERKDPKRAKKRNRELEKLLEDWNPGSRYTTSLQQNAKEKAKKVATNSKVCLSKVGFFGLV
jgi:hypothetical protein